MIKERIKNYCNKKNIAVSQFEKTAGISNGYFNNVKKRPSSSTIEKIRRAFPDLNTGWLLTGEGEMLKGGEAGKPPAPPGGHAVPLLPVAAQGGTLDGFSVSVPSHECEMVVSPVAGAELAIPITGDSMAPEYPNGAQVHVKRINERAFIEWGRVYVLDTCNGVVVKKVVPSDREGYVRCLSLNPDASYAPFDVNLEDVYGIYRVMLCLSVK